MSSTSTPTQNVSEFRQEAYQALKETFGWDDFRPGQFEVLEALHEHKAALALFPTGGGKSLCYQLYSQLVGEGLTIVVSPLIALMKDQVDDMLSRGIPAARIDSSLEWEELQVIRDDIRSGRLRLLYVAPERFNNENFRALVEGVEVALFAVDEAHCISQWGHNFRPDYLKLVEYANRLNAQAVLALTATATPEVVDDICTALEIPSQAAILASAYRPNLFIDISPEGKKTRPAVLSKKIKGRLAGTTVVYVTLQKTAEEVAAFLHNEGLPARPYHAGLPADTRDAIQEEWMKGDDRIVVATIAFGMGIDKADVRYIYHYDLPKSIEGYVQEIGRAGRDGKPSRVELLGNRQDLAQLASFSLGDTPAESDVISLVGHLLEKPKHFEVSTYKISNYFDIRQLPLATLLTYMEILGVMKQLTPQYGTYRITPKGGETRLLNSLPASARDSYKQLFSSGASGPKHITIDLHIAVAKTGKDRDQVLRSIQYLENEGLAEVQASGLMRVYEQLEHNYSPESLSKLLIEKFQNREKADLDRLNGVVEFVEISACKTAYLLKYFGEENPENCGHCAWCEDNSRNFSAAITGVAPKISDVLTEKDIEKIKALREKYPKPLSEPVKLTRFLLGISSPAVSAARLTRNAYLGILEGFPYAEVYRYALDL